MLFIWKNFRWPKFHVNNSHTPTIALLASEINFPIKMKIQKQIFAQVGTVEMYWN